MKRIPLTQGQVALVDDEDFARFGHLKWFAHWDPRAKCFYAHRNSRKEETGSKIKILHREIMSVTDPKVKVDHRNHDTLDNRRQNLRACTNAQNLSNRNGGTKNNKSGFRGVSHHTTCNRWAAYIRVNGKTKYLGLFLTEKYASAAYVAANRKYFGEFGGKSK